jgi:hypothetical protein
LRFYCRQAQPVARKEKKNLNPCFHRREFEFVGPTMFKSSLVKVVGLIACPDQLHAHNIIKLSHG